MAEPLLIGKNHQEIVLLPQLANRHGLIAGATGTGKTVTLQVFAESFSRIGVPVFAADVKGDLSGVSQPGKLNPKIQERIEKLSLPEYEFSGSPVTFWDVFGERGHPMRTTVSEMGPLLLARLLNLNDVQSGVLTLIFRVADDNGMLLLDLKDLRSMVQHVGENARRYTTAYGNISPASIGAIQRALLALEDQGGAHFFGEPAFTFEDLLQTDVNGRGVVNILAADKLILAPKLYATFLLFLLSDLFERLPEVGDADKPKLVFFFDEAHLLFNDAPAALQEKIEQVVRLIRSKGVGVYFITQSPGDVPESVLGQLGNRVQHALRAFTPKDQKVVRATAQTFRPNPELDAEAALLELGVGEALLSFLDAKGRPEIVQRALVIPPYSQIGPIDAAQRTAIISNSDFAGHYETVIDRESAYEILQARAEEAAAAAAAEEARKQAEQEAEEARKLAEAERKQAEKEAEATRKLLAQEAKEAERAAREAAREAERIAREEERMRREQAKQMEGMAKGAFRFLNSREGKSLVRGILGSLTGGKR
jgi:DNA helicase HerA-like ATPase